MSEWTGNPSPSETDLNTSLYSYGVDSTAALTLKMQLEMNLQVSFEVRNNSLIITLVISYDMWVNIVTSRPGA